MSRLRRRQERGWSFCFGVAEVEEVKWVDGKAEETGEAGILVVTLWEYIIISV